MKNTNNLKGKYLHHKGKYYDVLGEACDVKTNDLYIIYRQNYGHKHWWIRPKNMFFEKIVHDDDVRFRFIKIDDKVDIPEIKTRTFFVHHTENGEKYFAKYTRFYDQYMLFLENEYGDKLKLELSSWVDFSSKDSK